MPLIYKSRADLNPQTEDSVVAVDEAITALLADNLIEPVDRSDFEDSDKLLKQYVATGETSWQRLTEMVTELNTQFDDDDNAFDVEEVDYADANYVCEVAVTDPDSKGTVVLAVFKDTSSGGMFAIDSSFLEQVKDREDDAIPSPFNEDVFLHLKGLD